MDAIYTHCRIVTRDDIVAGSLVVSGDRITAIDEGNVRGRGGIDLGGDYLLPGLIEMHTDNLEKNIQPRPGVIWPSILSAALAHDAQVAGAGITTVCDAIAVGGLRESSLRSHIFNDSIEAISRARRLGLFKADHFLHLRCEISDAQMASMLTAHIDNPALRLLSIMDHTPGQRQWADLDKWRLYHRDKRWTKEEALAVISDRQTMQTRYAEDHRRLAVEIAHDRDLILASHDDTTCEDIDTASAEGVAIAEFPTTAAAAAAAKGRKMITVMGAPNAVRGVSHSGNISAAALARQCLLDGLSSDYVPASLLHSAFTLAGALELPLPQTVAMVSCNIADALRLTDRGELLPGKKADLLQVGIVDGLPILKKVWKDGRQIA